MSTPLDLIPLRKVRCTRCRKCPDLCRCWETCWCGTRRLRGLHRCPGEIHGDGGPKQHQCVCAAPEASRRECMTKQGNKTPCRCACHVLYVKPGAKA